MFLKRCFKCGVEKPRSEFYAHPQTADGLLGKCKRCTIGDAKANYRKDLSASREKKKWKNLSPENKAAHLRESARQRRLHPEKSAARSRVYRALKSGRLRREPCERCGALKVEAHHEDYAKPLEVRWLCGRHHREVEGRIIT